MRPRGRIPRLLIGMLALLCVVCAAGLFVSTRMAVFGGAPAGPRLARMQRSQHYRDVVGAAAGRLVGAVALATPS